MKNRHFGLMAALASLMVGCTLDDAPSGDCSLDSNAKAGENSKCQCVVPNGYSLYSSGSQSITNATKVEASNCVVGRSFSKNPSDSEVVGCVNYQCVKQKCPDGYHHDERTYMFCVNDNDCHENETYSNGSCVCDAARHWTGTAGSCTCASGYQLQGNQCVSQCGKGEVADSDGSCVCDTANHWTGNTGACKCDVGYKQYMNGANEISCVIDKTECNGKGVIAQEGSCVCDIRNHWIGDPHNCKCESGYDDVNGVCVKRFDGNTCNNGILDEGEECDGSLFLPDVNCTNMGYSGGVVTCNADCKLDYSNCVMCGDGKIYIEGYGCDSCKDGEIYNWTTHQCEKESSACGNNQLDDGEDCENFGDGIKYWDGLKTCQDKGYSEGNVYCVQCVANYEKCRCGQNEYYDTAILKCVSNGKCGNGVLDEGEACDDGNTINGDGCNKNCMIEEGYVCSNSAEETSICHMAACGNGEVEIEFGEECDSSEGCDEYCRCEKDNGFIYRDGMCLAATSLTCGDGILNHGELCEKHPDGRDLFGDKTCADYIDGATGDLRCTDNCELDLSACKDPAPVCGDGVVQDLEECDTAGDVSKVIYECKNDEQRYRDGNVFCSDSCELRYDKCVLTSCGMGKIRDKSGSCSCDKEKHWVNEGTRCVCDIDNHYKQYDRGVNYPGGAGCACDAENHWVEGIVDGENKCVCDAAGHWVEMKDGTGSQCVCDTDNNWVYNAETHECVCQYGYQYVEGMNACRLKSCTESDLNDGDRCYYGRYYQSKDGSEKSDLVWLVLERSFLIGDISSLETCRLLITEKVIDAMAFSSDIGDRKVQWAGSHLQTWLNSNRYEDDFMKIAFEPSEISKLVTVCHTYADDCDRVFVLSTDEHQRDYYMSIPYYLGIPIELDYYWTVGFPTDYAIKQGVSQPDNCTKFEYNGKTYCSTSWWLRSAGNSDNRVAYVQPDGEVFIYGISIDTNTIGVRPAICIK